MIRTLAEADISGLSELHWTPGEEFVLMDSRGESKMHGVLYKPADFDPTRKYPLIQWTYPGSPRILFQRTFVPGWHGSRKAQALAQLGFVTFVTRKSYDDAKPREPWNRFFPSSATADSVAVIRQLASQYRFIDMDRVGIYGSSKGGFYSISAILEAPEIYDVAVSVAGVTDFAAHMGNLPYLGPPDSEVFKRSSVLELADRLEGKLLLIHGTGDTSVPISHTMRLADALIRANKHFDMLIMPEETHGSLNISYGYGLDAAMRYFVEHLGP
jgi:dipeptidyl aminopeptidase/acylaminoacyl peptidase